MAKSALAVLAAAGPVILPCFGVGREQFAWFAAAGFGPYSTAYAPQEILFWVVVGVPVAVALLARYPRTAFAAVATALAYGVTASLLLPGRDPLGGAERAGTMPWVLVGSYAVALVLIAHGLRGDADAGRPLAAGGSRKFGRALWAGAAVAAAWAPVFDRQEAWFALFDASSGFKEGTTVYAMTRPAALETLIEWTSDADATGLPIALVALAAAVTGRWGSRAGIAIAAPLLLFPPFAAAAFAATAIWHPRPVLLKRIAFAAGITLGATWLIITSFSPTR